MIPKKAIKKIKNDIHLEIAVGSLVAYGVFPQTQEGIRKAKKTAASKDTWLAPSDLPEYYDGIDSDLLTGKETPGIISIRNSLKEFYGLSAGTTDFVDTTVYNPADKFVDDGKEFTVKIETNLEDALEKTSDKIMDSIDEILRQDQEKFEEFKQKQAEELKKKIEKINTPERVSQELTIKIPPAHYIQGTAGRWQPEFENDIDHAVYFAGKSPLPKGAKQREVLAWLKSLGLTFEQIHDHREKVLDQIRETISLPGVEEEYPYVYIDAVDQDFVIEDDEDYEEVEDDLDGLDDLLNLVRTDDDASEKEVAENIEEEIVDATEDEEEEGDIGSEDDIPDELLQEDVDPELVEKLLVTINKPKKESSYTSNKKIFDSITANFGRLQATLDVVNSNLEKQNSLIKASIESQLAVGELITNQTDMLGEKFDILLQHFERQNDVAEQQQENEKNKAAESKLEAQRDAAGVSDFENLLEKDGKSKKRGSKIEEYYKNKALRQLYRVLPKKLRSGIRKARNLRKIPGRIKGKVTSEVLRRSPQAVQRLARGAQAIRGAQSATRGAQALRGVRNVSGPARALFAGMEYGERKGQGQSEVQALAGTGGSLAGGAGGAVAGGGIGAGIGAALGGVIGFFFAGVGAAPGAVIGAKIGKVVGSLAGGWYGAGKGSEIADTITGADKVTGEHETGTGLTKPGTAMLHGTEAVINKDAASFDMSPMNTVGGVMIASTAQFINSAGPIAAPIAPTFKGVAAQMAKQYDVPATIAQTNIGGSLPSLSKELEKVKEKSPEEQLSDIEKDLLKTEDPQSFADKLLKMIDPQGKFQQLLQNIGSTSGFSGGTDLGESMVPGETIRLQEQNAPGGFLQGGSGLGSEGGQNTRAGYAIHYHLTPPSNDPVGWEQARNVAFTATQLMLQRGSQVWLGNVNQWASSNPETLKAQIVREQIAHTQPNRTQGGIDMQEQDPAGTWVSGKMKFPLAVTNVVDDISGGSGRTARIQGTNVRLAHGAKGSANSIESSVSPNAAQSPTSPPSTSATPTPPRPTNASPTPPRPLSTPTSSRPASSERSLSTEELSKKVIKSFNVGNFTYTQREGGIYSRNGIRISKELFDTTAKNHFTKSGVDPNNFDSSKISSSTTGNSTVAAVYGAGVPQKPEWMKKIDDDYNKSRGKPLNPGIPNSGRGMGDRWFPQASTDRGSEIASLSGYEQESGSNVVLINNQSSQISSMPSPRGVEIIQMGGDSSSEILKNLMLQRLG
jgi:hypothetical protein